MASHHEIHLESYIVQKLVENGWVEGHNSRYDPVRALYPEDVIAWVKAANPQAWEKLERHNGASAENTLLDRLEKALAAKSGGTIKVLREGLSVAGVGKIEMSQSAPEDGRNSREVEKYRHNILRVVRQLRYHPTREWAIDLGLFINGIPVATVELKTDFTQAIDDAILQYKRDRLPQDPKSKRREPLLTFRRGAVVHFAMSDSEIAMTTRLNGDKTHFLPFNKGNDGHAGNQARADGEYPVAYFWEEICQPEAWLRIFHSFVYVESKEKVDKYGMPYRAETLIFPRYHQFEAVNRMISDAREKGAGQQYLCEHSAGSGKTSTIAWTAHDLVKLRYPDGRAYFNSVIIVTDRTVLDAQLQEAVTQLDHQFGLIETIDANQRGGESKSKRLAEALMKGTPIIVVTIQTFPFAMEAIITERSLKARNFAVIIDEAHTSQTGSTAQGLRAALSLDTRAKMEEMTLEEVLLEVQKSRVRPANVSHFAFTATPKHSTLTLFGRPTDPTQPVSDDNKPESFHRYTQRQAIEEGFILDVLTNYTPYQQAVRLGDEAINDRRVDKKFARRALARWKSLHPTIVSQKVEFIIEHFLQNIAGLLNGEAKAMVVTSGRPQAVKYKLAFDQYINKHHRGQGLKALVAFSGKVPGSALGDEDETYPLGIDPEKEYTEYNLNPDASGDLRNEFERHEYQVMIVANKFQTGFNQPKLVAMYLDKKVSGVEAVQTLSRLNRTYPGKDETYVIDFVNEPQTILDAFRMYDDGAEMESVQDLDVVYDMQQILDQAGIYLPEDLEAFKQARGRALKDPDRQEPLHKKLYAATQRPADVFNSKLSALSGAIEEWDQAIDKARARGDAQAEQYAEAQRSEFSTQREALLRFKSDLGRFVRVYNYIAQLVELADAELENFAAFARLFSKRLKGVSPEQIDLAGLVLAWTAIKPQKEIGEEGEKYTLQPIAANESDLSDREKEFLHQIIARMNDLFGDVADDSGQRHFTNQVANITRGNPRVVEQVEKNTKEQALQGDLPDEVRKATVSAMKSHSDLARVLLKDGQQMAAFFSLVYDIIKQGEPDVLVGRDR
jgi:type I restriction enzyme R subunit